MSNCHRVKYLKTYLGNDGKHARYLQNNEEKLDLQEVLSFVE